MLVYVEVILTCLALVIAFRFPKLSGCVSLLTASGVGWAHSLFVHDGAQVLGRATMLAAVYAPELPHGYKVAVVPVPSHTERTLLIKVEAAALNPSNYKMLPAQIPFVRHLRSWVIGYDVSGTVVSVGKHSTCDVKIGDRVWGMAVSGSIAEYALLSCYEEMGMGLIPSKLSFAEAAGLPVAGLTGVAAYERSNLRRGDDVLVIGASGGCGIFGVGIAAHSIGANVTGICSKRNVDFVRGLGTHQVVDYTNDADMKRLTANGPQFDVIYDTVTSFAPEDPNYEPQMRPLLKAHGRYVAIGPSPDPLDLVRATLDVVTQLFGVGLQREGYDFFLLQPSRSRVRKLSRMFEEGQLSHVPIDSQHIVKSDQDMVNAMERMMSRRTVGKIIVSVQAGS